ncbi:MAG: hypothetical protein KJO22_05065, partial [Bacteroidia bacterium]|nr:hypothetical protein [Bacteroidia bacterium]
MRQRLIQLFLNPFVLAVLITVGIIYLLPDFFSKYKIVKVNEQYLSDDSTVYFEDLDHDGKSEKIVAQPRQDNKLTNASYVLFNSEGDLIDQYNLDKSFVDDRKIIWFRDLDNNGYKEIYIPTRSNDSSFLSIIEHKRDGSYIKNEVFVDVMTAYNDAYEFKYTTDIPFDKSMQYDTELYFGITNGYSGNPRNFYKYDPIRKIIIKSPHITNVSRVSEIQDLDSDKKNELLLLTHASGNTIDSTFTLRSDYSSWLTVLDNDMSFLFEPKEFKCLCSVAITALNVNDSIKLIAQIRSRQEQEFPSKLIRLSLDGHLEKETVLTVNSISSNLFKISEDTFGLYEFNSGSFNIYNHELTLINEYKLVPNLLLYHYDIDGDSQDEWLGLSRTNKTIYIYRSNFTDVTTLNIDFNLDVNSGSQYGLKQIDQSSNQFYFQTAN